MVENYRSDESPVNHLVLVGLAKAEKQINSIQPYMPIKTEWSKAHTQIKDLQPLNLCSYCSVFSESFD